jgi:hypothetical protein
MGEKQWGVGGILECVRGAKSRQMSTHASIHTHTHPHAHTYIHTHIHTHTHTHTHTLTHTHTHMDTRIGMARNLASNLTKSVFSYGKSWLRGGGDTPDKHKVCTTPFRCTLRFFSWVPFCMPFACFIRILAFRMLAIRLPFAYRSSSASNHTRQ